MDLAILTRMPVITHILTANGPCPDEQQSIPLSGFMVDKFKQQLRPGFSHVPLFRLDDQWTLVMVTLRSPAQYKGQQRSPWTRPNDEARSKRAKWRSESGGCFFLVRTKKFHPAQKIRAGQFSDGGRWAKGPGGPGWCKDCKVIL